MADASMEPSATDEVYNLSPPDLLTAVQEQLGIQLLPSKANLEVVDHVDRIHSAN
jgi:uncharacterized protein (TIGR03435 family)